MAERKPWTRDELILAMNLYCKLPFGKLHRGNPDVIRLAAAIGRTPSSAALELVNFASFDPALQARGAKGMTRCSGGPVIRPKLAAHPRDPGTPIRMRFCRRSAALSGRSFAPTSRGIAPLAR